MFKDEIAKKKGFKKEEKNQPRSRKTCKVELNCQTYNLLNSRLELNPEA
jgi:hypothetical protein